MVSFRGRHTGGERSGEGEGEKKQPPLQALEASADEPWVPRHAEGSFREGERRKVEVQGLPISIDSSTTNEAKRVFGSFDSSRRDN